MRAVLVVAGPRMEITDGSGFLLALMARERAAAGAVDVVPQAVEVLEKRAPCTCSDRWLR